MLKKTKTTEILAPAGSVEQLVTAVNNGCDSVYLGLDSFNARMKAPNFTAENVGKWIDYCHLFGVKVYVTINTSLKNDEFHQAVELLNSVYKNHADGVIVTDIALLKLASQFPAPFEVVASTQLNIHDDFGAEFIKNCGATTVVCARESSLNEIRKVASTGVKVECFIHGATCVCQSGQCLFSAMVGGNSGNRGLCAQPCRKLYRVNDDKNYSYLLSARDLCGLDIAKQLTDSGVSVFKIEGRNRRAEYAGITSHMYHKLFENNFAHTTRDFDNLAEMYNRSMSHLNYLSGDNSNIICKEVQNHVGVKVGIVKGKGFVAEKPMSKGDGLKIFDGQREICGAVAQNTGIGYIIAEFSDTVRDGMEVRRTTSVELCSDVLNTRRLLPISLKFEAFPGQQCLIYADCNGVTASCTSDFVVPEAIKTPISVSEVVEQLHKTGNSYYTISDIDINIGNIFLAKSQINAMRRQIFDKLTSEIVNRYNMRFEASREVSIGTLAPLSTEQNESDHLVAVICKTLEQLRLANGRANYLIYKPELISEQTVQQIVVDNCFVDLPAFSDNTYLENIFAGTKVGVVCHNLGHVQLARKLGLPYIAGSGLNIYNDYIANEFNDAETFVYSHELTLQEISKFANQSGLVFVDGQIVLMKLVHCPYKVAYGCACSSCKANLPLTYTDELGNDFQVSRRRDSRCTFELINGKKLSAISKINKRGRYLVDFDEKVINHYVALNNGANDNCVEPLSYTKGRLFSKVN